MRKQSASHTSESSVTWHNLEEWIRGHVQQTLKEEVTELLGRWKSDLRQGVDEPLGYCNSYGKPRRLTLSCRMITVRRLCVRECDERLGSRVLSFFKRKNTAVAQLLPELYLHRLGPR